MARSKKKRAGKPKRGYAGGEKVVTTVKELKYASDGRFRDLGAGADAVEAVDKFTFNPENQTMFGHGDCGDARFVATNKAEAEQLIEFIKSCYDIK